MALLLLLVFPILELYVLVKVGSRIGVINTLFALIATGVIGAGLAKAQGRYIFGKLQAALARGEMPADQILHGILIFIAGVLFLIPGFVSDAMALFLVLPGTRHLMVAWMKRKMTAQMRNGGFRVFTTGTFGGGFGGFRTGPFGKQTQSSRSEEEFGFGGEDRDVTPKVIDVTPISSDSRPKSEPEENESPER